MVSLYHESEKSTRQFTTISKLSSRMEAFSFALKTARKLLVKFMYLLFYYGIGGNDMKDNYLLMFKVTEVYKFFKDIMRLDIYDRCTMEWISRNTLKDLSLNELFEMEETVLVDINNSSRSNSSFWAGLSVVMALFIGTFAIIISMYPKLGENHDYKLVLLLVILLGQLILILLAFRLEQYISKKRNKLYDLIRVLIHIKGSEQNT